MQEEELSVSEILSSIRQVLSKEAEALDTAAAQISTDKSSDSLSTEKENQEDLNDFVIELTPQMRVNNESLLSPETVSKAQAAFDKINQVKSGNTCESHLEADLKPILREWLNKHLTEIVERVVTQEVRRLIDKK